MYTGYKYEHVHCVRKASFTAEVPILARVRTRVVRTPAGRGSVPSSRVLDGSGGRWLPSGGPVSLSLRLPSLLAASGGRSQGESAKCRKGWFRKMVQYRRPRPAAQHWVGWEPAG